MSFASCPEMRFHAGRRLHRSQMLEQLLDFRALANGQVECKIPGSSGTIVGGLHARWGRIAEAQQRLSDRYC